MFQDLSRLVINLGIILIVVGAVLWIFGKLPFIGKLPGDVLVQKPNFTLYAPLATMFIISIILSVLLTIISNLKR